jgi:hypothetical protein
MSTQKQYLLSVYHVDGEPMPSGDALKAIIADVDVFNAKLQKSGAWVFAGGLFPPSTATVVRAKGGEMIVSDGPFSEAKEHIGGFWIVQCSDLDAAVALAREGTRACRLPVEVRPFQEPPTA